MSTQRREAENVNQQNQQSKVVSQNQAQVQMSAMLAPDQPQQKGLIRHEAQNPGMQFKAIEQRQPMQQVQDIQDTLGGQGLNIQEIQQLAEENARAQLMQQMALGRDDRGLGGIQGQTLGVVSGSAQGILQEVAGQLQDPGMTLEQLQALEQLTLQEQVYQLEMMAAANAGGDQQKQEHDQIQNQIQMLHQLNEQNKIIQKDMRTGGTGSEQVNRQQDEREREQQQSAVAQSSGVNNDQNQIENQPGIISEQMIDNQTNQTLKIQNMSNQHHPPNINQDQQKLQLLQRLQQPGQQEMIDGGHQQNVQAQENDLEAIQNQIQSLRNGMIYQQQSQEQVPNQMLGQMLSERQIQQQIQLKQADQQAAAHEQAQADFDQMDMNQQHPGQLAESIGLNLNDIDLANLTPVQLEQLSQLQEFEKLQSFELLKEQERIHNIESSIQMELLQKDPNLQLKDIQQYLYQQNENDPNGNLGPMYQLNQAGGDPNDLRIQQALLAANDGVANDGYNNQHLLSNLQLAGIENQQNFELHDHLQQPSMHENNIGGEVQHNVAESMIMDQPGEIHQEDFSMHTERMKEIERKRDIEFEKHLRIFYKSMIERLNNQAVDKLSKKSKAFCEQIDKIQSEYIQEKKDQKTKKAKIEKKAKSEAQSPNPNNDSQNEQDREPGEDNDADSSFYSLLYGRNSALDPDAFISEVLQTIKNHSDLTKWFKRFLPEDDEEDEQSAERKYWQFRTNMNMLIGDSDGENPPSNHENMQFDDEAALINQMKRDSYRSLIKLLAEYNDVKGKRCTQDALKLYGEKIMTIAEKFQKIVASDIHNQMNNNGHQSMMDMSQRFVTDQNGNVIQELNYTDQLESQMNSILAIIPPEVIDNYDVSHAGQKQETSLSKQNKTNQASPSENEKRQRSDINTKKKPGRPKGKTQAANTKPAEQIKAEAAEDFVSSSRIESSDENESANSPVPEAEPEEQDGDVSMPDSQEASAKLLLDQEVEDGYEDEDEEGEQDQEDEEGESRSSSHNQYSEDRENDSESEVMSGRGRDADGEGSEAPSSAIRRPDHPQSQQSHAIRIRSVLSELATHQPANYKNLNKYEIKILDNVRRQLKSENEWLDFIKMFLLYFEGVIGLKGFFQLFDDKFGYKVKSDLKKDLQILLPTRENNRRLQSDILKPWNDLENQKFEKIQDSSYYKIDHQFPLPICSAKLDPRTKHLYQPFLNEDYLSLAMGSENFKFKDRNVNENSIFKNEDEMYKLDTQIEMFEKCQAVVENEIKVYDELRLKNPKEQAKYEFPRHKFRPLMYYWEKKYKDALIPFLMLKPFQREYLMRLRDGLGGKLQELQNQKFDQLAAFEDVYRKNFIKSLDHRSFQYKEFIKKFQQKQHHMAAIKQIAQQNQSGIIRSENEMKGSNFEESPFYHSFGQFIQHDFSRFDLSCDKQPIEDFPIDMNYDNFKEVAKHNIEKLPHMRLMFKDEEAKGIAIKILLLHIRYSTAHHTNDRPRLTENLRQILENFMDIKEYKRFYQSCGYGKVESLTPPQIELIMNKNSHLYYLKRCQRLNRDQQLTDQEEKDLDVMIYDRVKQENPESSDIKNQSSNSTEPEPIKIQIQGNDATVQVRTSHDNLNSPIKENSAEKEDEIDSPMNEMSPSTLKKTNEKNEGTAVKNPSQANEANSPEKIKAYDSPSKNTELYQKINMNKFSADQKACQEKLVSEALFLPHYQDQKSSEISNGEGNDYHLFYGPSNIFMFLKFFYAIYERVLKAKDLILEKIHQDLSEMSHNEKVQAGISHPETGELNSEIVREVFLKERYEHLLKGIFATTTQQICSSNGGLASGGAGSASHHFYSHNHHLMDHNKYEDFARQLLGNNAFLLFQIDKIVSHAIKQIQQMHSDHACQKALRLYQALKSGREADEVVLSDPLYLNYYAEQIVDQLSVKECQNNSSYTHEQNDQECKHSVSKFKYGSQGINLEGLNEKSKNDGNAGGQGGGTAAANTLSASAAASQQSNFQVFRLLWSSKSNIMSVHYINLNPYQIQLSGSRNFKRVMAENYKLIKESTLSPLAPTNSDQGGKCKCSHTYNRLDDMISPPIFLKRNLKVMRKFREFHERGPSRLENAMELHVAPTLNTIVYQSRREDILVHPRSSRKSKLNVKDRIKQEYKMQYEAAACRQKRMKVMINEIKAKDAKTIKDKPN